MSRSEKAELNDALVEVSRMEEGALVFRNNTGQAWQGRKLDTSVGQTVVVRPGMVVLAEARPIRFGLLGSGDLMGTVGGFAVAGEMKSTTGRQRTEQGNFERAWTKAGGIYVLARTAEQMVSGIREAIKARRRAT